MDEILAATTIHQKRQVLDRMASGLGLQDAYNTTLDRIRHQDGGKSKLGMAALMWASRCERPLRWEELRHALGVDLVAGEFTIDNVPSVRTVLGCTLGLVTIDENESTVRLLHLTLQEYLGASSTVFETPQSMMAKTCLIYLNTLSFQAPRRNPGGALDMAVEKSPFLEYATHFWGTHAAREVTEEVKSRALQLLDGYESHVSARIFPRRKRWRCQFGEEIYGISGLHCIAFWGIAEIAVAMLEKKKWDVNGRDSRGDTPLMWAVRYGNDRVVELLLEQGDTRPDVGIPDGSTVLSFAAGLGNEGAVKLLLGRVGVGPDSSDSNRRTPLSHAASRGHESVVKLLLERKEVNPDSSDEDGQTPLSLAASKGYKDVVKLQRERKEVNHDSLTTKVGSHQELTHQLIATNDTTLHQTDLPLDALVSGSVPPEAPQEQPPQFKPSPPGQLHLRVATPIPTHAPRSISPSSSAPLLSPRSTSGTASDPIPSKPSGALKRCLRAIRELFCLS